MARMLVRLLFVVVLCGFTSISTLAAEAPHDGEAAHKEGGHHEVALPMTWRTDLALFSLITFVVYVTVLKTGAWGQLAAGLNERERGIRQNIADAEANRVKSESLLKDYEQKLSKVQEEVRDILAEARRDADHTKQDIIMTAQKEAEATKQRAINEIERSKDQALAELFDFVSNNVIGATEQVLGRSLSSDDQNRLVTDALSKMNVRRN